MEKYLDLINKDNVQPDSYIICQWDFSGIYIDFYYDPEGASELIFCCDSYEEDISEENWQKAKEIAKYIGDALDIEACYER